MLHIAVCDDDERYLEKVRLELELYANEYSDFIYFADYYQVPFDLLEHIEGGAHYDVFLLDIYMQGITGIDLAREVRKSNSDARIIFLTMSMDYAVDAFEIQALHYLKKPIEHEQFFCAMNRVRDSYREKKLSLVAKIEKGYEHIQFSDIIYVESCGKVQRIVLSDRYVMVNSTLANLTEQLLKDKAFVSPHRAYLVNMQYIVTLNTSEIIMRNNDCIPISRGKHKRVKEDFFSWSFSSMPHDMGYEDK